MTSHPSPGLPAPARVALGPAPADAAATPRATDHAAALAALPALWAQHRDRNLSRVDLLEEAGVAVLQGELDAELRALASQAAHQLAGSLGTFGLPSGTELARDVEALLARDTVDPLALSEAVVALRDRVTEHRPPTAGTGSPTVADGSVDLPASLALGQASAGVADGRSTHGRGAARVLAVSAEPTLATQLTQAAVALGLQLELCPAAKAAERVSVSDYDIVLVDLDDPEGPAALAELGRLSPTVPAVPSREHRRGAVNGTDVAGPALVALSEGDSWTHRLEAVRAGAAMVYTKPTGGRTLLATLAATLGRTASTAGGTGAAEIVVVLVGAEPEGLAAAAAALADLPLRASILTEPDRALTALEAERAEAVVVDLDSMGTAGLDLTRVLRADPVWQLLPVLALTSRVDSSTARQAYAAGVDDVVAARRAKRDLAAKVLAQARRWRALREQSDTDPVSGAATRRATEQALVRMLRLADRQGVGAAVALLRVEDLARLNVLGGPGSADGALRALAGMLTGAFREEDIVGRWEEDALVLGLFAMSAEEAATRLHTLAEEFGQTRFGGTHGRTLSARVSAGVAETPRDGGTLEALAGAAAQARARAAERGTAVLTAAANHVDSDADTDVDVVVVEDDESVSGLLAHALTGQGRTVRVIADGAEAAELLGEGRVRGRVVLLDMGLPGRDGFAVLAHLRDRGVLERSRVVVLTARSAEAETLRALRLGAFDHVAKPFSVPVLMRRIERAMGTT